MVRSTHCKTTFLVCSALRDSRNIWIGWLGTYRDIDTDHAIIRQRCTHHFEL